MKLLATPGNSGHIEDHATTLTTGYLSTAEFTQVASNTESKIKRSPVPQPAQVILGSIPGDRYVLQSLSGLNPDSDQDEEGLVTPIR